MSDVGNAFRIPQFLQARTEDNLVRAMLMNNLAHGMEFRYFDIQQKKNGQWVAWFYLEVDRMKFMVEEINGRTGQ